MVALWSRGAGTLLECGFVSRAQAWAEQSLSIFKGDTRALWVLRFSQTNPSLANRYFQVLLEGTEGDDGFYISYSVIARNANEAARLCLEMESPRHSEPLAVKECNALGKCDKTPIGVFEVGGYCFFPLDAPDD